MELQDHPRLDARWEARIQIDLWDPRELDRKLRPRGLKQALLLDHLQLLPLVVLLLCPRCVVLPSTLALLLLLRWLFVNATALTRLRQMQRPLVKTLKQLLRMADSSPSERGRRLRITTSSA